MNRGIPKWLTDKQKTMYLHLNPLVDGSDYGLLLKNVMFVESTDGQSKSLIFDIRTSSVWATDDAGNPTTVKALDFKQIKIGTAVAVKQPVWQKSEGFSHYVVLGKTSVTNPLEFQLDQGASYINIILGGSDV